MKSVLAIIIVALLLAVAGGAGYLLYTRSVAPVSAPPQQQSSSPSSSSSQQQLPKSIAKELEDSTTDPQILEKLMYEVSKNPDTVGWLKVPGTEIDNSVVQSHSNSYYLRRDERKQDSVYGCYFADHESSISGRENLTQNTIIYGHSDLKDNPDGPKFSQLFRFADTEFAAQNLTILLSTPEETLEWEIFASFYTDISFDYIRASYTPEEQKVVVDTAVKLSEHNYGILPTAEDKIITLSTCSVRDGNDGNHRFVVMARLKSKA